MAIALAGDPHRGYRADRCDGARWARQQRDGHGHTRQRRRDTRVPDPALKSINNDGPLLDVACELLKSNAGTPLSSAWTGDDDGTAGTTAVREVVPANGTDTFGLDCQTIDDTGSDNFVHFLRMTALRVGTITTQ